MFLRKTIYITFIIIMLALNVLPVFAQTEIAVKNLKDAFQTEGDGNDDPLDSAASNAGYDTSNAGSRAETIIGTVISTLLSLLGIIFLILMIYGGYKWMIARGNEQDVTKAKDIMTAAVIGLLIVMGAYLITWFVIGNIGTSTLK